MLYFATDCRFYQTEHLFKMVRELEVPVLTIPTQAQAVPAAPSGASVPSVMLQLSSQFR